MPLTGAQFGELIETLLEAFHWASLGQLVRIKFEIDLASEIGGAAAPFRTVATDWVKWLEQRGRTADFVGYMWAERKTVERVRRFYTSYLGRAAEVAGPPVAADFGAARDKVIEFKLYFRESESQFGYLNAYKDLHDRLHTLHEMREGIAQAAERLRKQPPDPMALEIVAEDLQIQVLAARRSAATLEEPDDARWLDAFAKGVEGLAAAAKGFDLALLDHSVKALRELPSQHQAGLNAELVKSAKRLKAERLGRTANEILTRFAAGAPLLTEFRTRLGGFGGLCDQLARQIGQHDSCQAVELALAPYEAAPDVSAERIPDWPNLAGRLAKLAADRPGDLRAERAAAASVTFAAARGAAAVDSFSGLLLRFRRLFHEADKELLAATDDLVREAELLNVQLRALTNVPD